MQEPLFGESPAIAESLAPSRHLGCIFCDYDNPKVNTVLLRGRRIYVRADNFPASDGHVEIVPFRHVESFFELEDREVREIRSLARSIRYFLQRRYRPDGYTIGVNDGQAAGRTVHHLHMHIIPRWFGDVPRPEGGIRNIFPGFDPSGWLA